jgi:uncharacterized protein (UPF0332 family)
LTNEQRLLIAKAEEGLRAAKLLTGHAHYGPAVSEAHYAMFRSAKALILGKGLTHSKHSAVISSFGREFAKVGLMPVETHCWLIAAGQACIVADYTTGETAKQDAESHVEMAERFMLQARTLLEQDRR